MPELLELKENKFNTIKNFLISEIRIRESITETFRKKYRMDMRTFEKKLAEAKIREHPTWEESIEWRNALEDIEVLKRTLEVIKWTSESLERLTKSLKTSGAS